MIPPDTLDEAFRAVAGKRSGQNAMEPLSTNPQPEPVAKCQPVALTIAGFDPSSGAGVAADIQVFAAHGLFGVAAITAQTVQSTEGVFAVVSQDSAVVAETLKHLADDFSIAGIKIGMLGTSDIAAVVAQSVRKIRERTPASPIPIVFDPVMVSSSGRRLLDEDALEVLREHLLPQVDWVTPNWSELAALTDEPVESVGDVHTAAEQLARVSARLNIVATGGDQDRALDFLRAADGSTALFDRPKIDSSATHGTGCAFSSALLAHLLSDATPQQAVAAAKAYVEGAILEAPGLGKGRGPLNFFWQQRSPHLG